MPRLRRQGRISAISVEVANRLRKEVTMTTMRERAMRQQASDNLMAELNAGLRARDSMRIMKQQLRLQTLAEVRERLVDLRVAHGDSTLDLYPRIDGMLEQMEHLPPA